MTNKYLRWFIFLFVSGALLIIIDQGVWQIPNWVLKRDMVKISSRCSQVKPGMSFSDVLRVMHDGARPFDESLAENDMHFFWDARHECRVELDGTRRVVVKAYAYDVQPSVGFNSN